jgi:hypothetical protein
MIIMLAELADGKVLSRPFRIPQGFRLKAQGCELTSNPGSTSQNPFNPAGVVASIPQVPLILLPGNVSFHLLQKALKKLCSHR